MASHAPFSHLHSSPWQESVCWSHRLHVLIALLWTVVPSNVHSTQTGVFSVNLGGRSQAALQKHLPSSSRHNFAPGNTLPRKTGGTGTREAWGMAEGETAFREQRTSLVSQATRTKTTVACPLSLYRLRSQR